MNNGKIVQEQWTAIEEPSYVPFLKNLFPAEAVICATLGDKAKIKLFKEYAELGLFKKAPIFIAESSTLSANTLKEMDNNTAGITAVEQYLPGLSYPENIRYLDAYRETYQEDPPESAVDAYNCMRVTLGALKKTGGDMNPHVLKEALLGLEIDLPTGPLVFSEGRVGTRTVFIREVVNDGNRLQWQIKKEYSLIKTHQQTYP